MPDNPESLRRRIAGAFLGELIPNQTVDTQTMIAWLVDHFKHEYTAGYDAAGGRLEQLEAERETIVIQSTGAPPRRQHQNAAGRSVLQDWTNDITFMMQSVLITACRGPDGIRKDHPVKVLIRYLRRSFLICAFDGKVRWSPYEPGGGSFTGPLKLDGLGPNEGHIDKFIEVYLRHVDELPHHFQLHMMHAAEILGYKHPDDDVREFWRTFYRAIVNDAHLVPESEETMDTRLGDVEKNWRAAEQGVTAL